MSDTSHTIFDFTKPWAEFSVDQALDGPESHKAVCGSDKNCTVARAARRHLVSMGFENADAWVIALMDDDSHRIIGHRLTVKAQVDGDWWLFYWDLGPQMNCIAAMNDENVQLPRQNLAETLLKPSRNDPFHMADRKSEVRSALTPEQAEKRRSDIEVARSKRKLALDLGKQLDAVQRQAAPGEAFKKIAATAQGNGLSLAACQQAFQRSQERAERPPRGFGGRRRVHAHLAGTIYTGQTAQQ